MADRSGQDNLLPHLTLLALHNQQLTQLTLQQKESIEELKKENEHLKQKVNKDVEQQVAELKESLKLKIQELEREKQAQATVIVESKQEIEALKHVVNKCLKREVAELRRHQNDDSLHLYMHVLPIEFVVTNFTERKRSNRMWYSLPLYTPTHKGTRCVSGCMLMEMVKARAHMSQCLPT